MISDVWSISRNLLCTWCFIFNEHALSVLLIDYSKIEKKNTVVKWFIDDLGNNTFRNSYIILVIISHESVL